MRLKTGRSFSLPDHGLTKYGGHALGTGAVAEEVYLFAHGQGIRTPTTLNEPMEQRDISMLLSALLKVDLPVTSDARIPIDALDVDVEQQTLLEEWNWLNVLAHNELVESEFGTGLDGLTDDPEWALLEEEFVSIPFLQIALTLVLSMVLFYAMYRSIPKESVTITSSRLQMVSLLTFSIGFYVFSVRYERYK